MFKSWRDFFFFFNLGNGFRSLLLSILWFLFQMATWPVSFVSLLVYAINVIWNDNTRKRSGLLLNKLTPWSLIQSTHCDSAAGSGWRDGSREKYLGIFQCWSVEIIPWGSRRDKAKSSSMLLIQVMYSEELTASSRIWGGKQSCLFLFISAWMLNTAQRMKFDQ